MIPHACEIERQMIRMSILTTVLFCTSTILSDGLSIAAEPSNLASASPSIAAVQICTIDLPTTIMLAERKNPSIAIAREAIFANLALQQQAKSLLFPTLVAGGNLHIHEGVWQRDTGQILNVNSESLYLGGGAGAIGAGTVAIPAVRIYAPLSNALFEPLIAEQRVAVSRYESRAATNEILLQAILAYLNLVSAEASRTAFVQADADAMQIVATVDAFVRVGQARKSDADRARARALLLRNQVYQADERAGVAAAQLAQVLSLDPSVRLHCVRGQVQAIDVVDPSYNLPSLLQIALRRRPEIAARSAAVALTEARHQEERWRPLMPTVSAGYSAGEFGTGVALTPPTGYQSGGRNDFDVEAVWTLQNAGLGNAALQRQRQAEVDLAISDRARTADLIRQQVAEAYATQASRRQQLEFTRRQLTTADTGFREELGRTRGGEGLPIEVVNSLDLLTRASQDTITAAIEFDKAQFQLFVAIGNEPSVAVRGIPPAR